MNKAEFKFGSSYAFVATVAVLLLPSCRMKLRRSRGHSDLTQVVHQSDRPGAPARSDAGPAPPRDVVEIKLEVRPAESGTGKKSKACDAVDVYLSAEALGQRKKLRTLNSPYVCQLRGVGHNDGVVSCTPWYLRDTATLSLSSDSVNIALPNNRMAGSVAWPLAGKEARIVNGGGRTRGLPGWGR